MNIKKSVLFSVLMLLVPAVQAQAPITYNVAEDAYVISTVPAGVNNGTIMESRVNGSAVSRSFVRFDLSSIPKDAIVLSALLKLSFSGTVDTTNTTVQRSLASWGEGSVTFSNQPATETADAVNPSYILGGYHNYNVYIHVLNMVRGNYANYGWCIKRRVETATTTGNTYYTKEYNAGSNIPQLVIQYYVPYKVSAATIVHASTLTSTNGSISPVVTNGPTGTTQYQWFDSSGTAISGATGLNLANVGKGWYGLRITGSLGEPVYYAFVVGVQCEEITLSFNPGPNYIDDAVVYDLNDATKAGNYHYFETLRTAHWTGPNWYTTRALLKFRLWVDPEMEVTQANLNLFGADHRWSAPLSNKAELIKITDSWQEKLVTFNNRPASSNSIITLVPATTSSFEDKTLDIKNFWGDWKSNNLMNYGMYFQLSAFNNTYDWQAYHSSDATNAAKRPNIDFKFSLTADDQPCACNNPIYCKLEKELKGVNYPLCSSKLQFFYEEEYTGSLALKYVIKNYKNDIVMSNSTLPLPKKYGYNPYEINVGTLPAGTYILEATNEKNEKFYLRFTR